MNNDKEYLDQLRHSAAHLLAAAVQELWPNSKRTIGPAIDNGFYFDFDFGDVKLSEEDFPKIEAKMKELVKTWSGFERSEVSKEQALEDYKDNEYKTELINEFSKNGETITYYKSGDYSDLCEGGHVENPAKEIGAFKILSLAGAYWRGSEKNKMLTRIYATAFPTQAELDEYLNMLEEAKKRDHRKLGKEMQLFHFEEEIGQGLPIWLPNGNIIKDSLENWAKETETEWGYQRVTTPVITKENLFYTSGHLPLYKDSMYAPIVIEEENYYIKPMNCPFHHKVFSSSPRSYKELPLRVCEYGLCHRYEDSGSLFGLMRVRGMDMNDAHIYCTHEQAVEEFVTVIKLHEYYYKILGIKEYEMELALRNPEKMDKYHGEDSDWELAEKMTREAMEKSGVPYKVVHDGAAFYGPKMDFQIKSSIGRMFTASTNQLDLYMPKKFDLKYTDSDGQEKTPVVIHRAPLGTHERFVGFLIEHFGGNFPVWMHPSQVAVLAISAEKHADYAVKVKDTLKKLGIRVSVNIEAETLGNKIRKAQADRTPYMIVIGDKEMESGNLAIRKRTGDSLNMTLEEFGAYVQEKVSTKSLEL
jgi:threonyl-tRNA synthetase